MGFDTNWIAIFSRMYLPKDKQITEVFLVGSQPCKILPKSLLLLDNGNLVVSSYSSQGVKIRIFKTKPFIKLRKGKKQESQSQTTLASVSGWSKEAGVQQFVELRFKWPMFKLYNESLVQDPSYNPGPYDHFLRESRFFRFDRRSFFVSEREPGLEHYKEKAKTLPNSFILKDCLGKLFPGNDGAEDKSVFLLVF